MPCETVPSLLAIAGAIRQRYPIVDPPYQYAVAAGIASLPPQSRRCRPCRCHAMPCPCRIPSCYWLAFPPHLSHHSTTPHPPGSGPRGVATIGGRRVTKSWGSGSGSGIGNAGVPSEDETPGRHVDGVHGDQWASRITTSLRHHITICRYRPARLGPVRMACPIRPRKLLARATRSGTVQGDCLPRGPHKPPQAPRRPAAPSGPGAITKTVGLVATSPQKQ
jgi:hypothetical protein